MYLCMHCTHTYKRTHTHTCRASEAGGSALFHAGWVYLRHLGAHFPRGTSDGTVCVCPWFFFFFFIPFFFFFCPVLSSSFFFLSKTEKQENRRRNLLSSVFLFFSSVFFCCVLCGLIYNTLLAALCVGGREEGGKGEGELCQLQRGYTYRAITRVTHVRTYARTHIAHNAVVSLYHIRAYAHCPECSGITVSYTRVRTLPTMQWYHWYVFTCKYACTYQCACTCI